ncbi:hypothetical protein OB03_12415, partial [Brevundimonas sp. GN22]
IQRQIDLINLTKQYSDAQVANAAETAKTYLDALHEAEDASRQLDKDREARLKQMEREEQTAQLLNDQLMSRLQHEAELARLSGDPVRMENAERELYIATRINELLRDRPELTPPERKGVAEDEWDELTRTDREGKLRDTFKRSFTDGIRAAIDGDIGGFFENMADRFTDRMLDNLADNLFDLFSEAMKGMSNGSSGGGIFSAIAKLFPGYSSGGYTGAGGVNQPAGVVHAGEIVWSQRDIARAGGVSVVEAMRKGVTGYSAGGIVQAPKLPSVNSTVSQLRSQQTAGTHPLVI